MSWNYNLISIVRSISVAGQRRISFDKLSNKRITRLSSDIELDPNARLINRNPRNLEQLSIEPKPKGFWLEKYPNHCRLRVVLVESGNQLEAYLQHWSGRRLVEASTKEPRLAKYFKNPTTTQAASVIAQVLSRRCLQSGYLYAGVEDHSIESGGPKMETFYKIMQSNGFSLGEPAEIQPRCLEDM